MEEESCLALRSLYHPRYLGDSIYCGIYLEGLVIGTCNDGKILRNVIYLEPSVFDELVKFYEEECK